jgi:hypothetical protein
MPIDYEAARELLERAFVASEEDLLRQTVPQIPEELSGPFAAIFSSTTQAYRECLAGCTIARIQDKGIQIRLPYTKQGPRAYNGRTLDEKVVNPFLQARRIPCSRGPFLSVFRRSIQFDEATARGVRDVVGFRAFLELVTYLEQTADDQALARFLRRLARISLEQYGTLISGLLATPSGGRFPVLLVTAAFSTIKDFFGLDWDVRAQGINVADAAAGVGGDITIMQGGRTLLAAEITERPLDRSRVVSTFNTKIARLIRKSLREE